MDQSRLPHVQKHYDSGNMAATQRDATAKGVVWLSLNSTHKRHSDYLEPAAVASWQKERKAVPTALLADDEGAIGKA